MATNTGDATLTLPIYTRFAGKEHHIGDVTLDVKIVAGRPKAPTVREITAAIRKLR